MKTEFPENYFIKSIISLYFKSGLFAYDINKNINKEEKN